MAAIRSEGHAINKPRMADEFADFIAARGVPEVYIVIVAAREERVAIVTQCQAVDVQAMVVTLDLIAGPNIPKASRRVPAYRQDLAIVGMKGDGPYLLGVTP